MRRAISVVLLPSVTLIAVLLAGTTAAQGATSPPPTAHAAVVGGTPVTEGADPFLALLMFNTGLGYKEYCGGSLIAEQWVLTAAHCVTAGAPAKPDAVLIGRMVIADTSVGDTNSADQVIVNPDWDPTKPASDPTRFSNDFALIHLAHASPGPEIRPVDESQDPLVGAGAQATVIGLGDTVANDPTSQPSTVQTAPQTVQSDGLCNLFYSSTYIASTMLCAGQPNVSPCFGDSGGPLFLSLASGPIQIGVVSHGPKTCGIAPGVYSRVSSARGWIRQTMAAQPSLITRLSGADRVATAIAISNQGFAQAGSAGAVVLANSAAFADALPGTPLAAAKHAPLLLTDGTTIDPRVTAEIQRVLPATGTIYLLGGPSALSPDIAAQLSALGYTVVRYGGPNRFATAVMIADGGLGNPATILEATGLNFADALAGGAAAVAAHAAILLTAGSTQAPDTAAYLAAHGGNKQYALGGPAAAADPTATPVIGADRYDTAVRIAKTFFPSFSTFGAADGASFPDALAGGAHIAALGGPMLLVPPASPMAPSVIDFLTSQSGALTSAWVYGGTTAVTPETIGELVLLAS